MKWIRGHYTLDQNPGMGQAGLFYYYHTFAKALTAWGEEPVIGRQGRGSRLAGGSVRGPEEATASQRQLDECR